MKSTLYIFIFWAIASNSLASSEKIQDAQALHKSFGTCYIANLESGNEYIFRQCSELVFQGYDSSLKELVQSKKLTKTKNWNEYQIKAYKNKEICQKTARQTKKNHTLLNDLILCDFMLNDALLNKASQL